MPSRNFRDQIEKKWSEGNFVCVGLDSDFAQIPLSLRSQTSGARNTQAMFNRQIVKETADLAAAYKLNPAFYVAQGVEGVWALHDTISYIHTTAPEVSVILDAKFADIGNINEGYVEFAFDYLGADAVTVNPYLGREALQAFLNCADKCIFVLCRTSNPGAHEFQDLLVDRNPLYRHVARDVARFWNTHGNCGLVAGATRPTELEEIRCLVGDMPLLIPGIGAQGGDVEATVRAGKDDCGHGMIINASRSIIFASNGEDYADAARQATEKLHQQIQAALAAA